MAETETPIRPAEAEEVEGAVEQAPAPAVSRRMPLRMPGRKKAAILLVALGADKAAHVFKHLREDEIEGLSLEMAKLGSVSQAATDAVFEEAAQTALAYASLAEGGVEYAREVLERAIGSERAAEIIGRLVSVIEMRPFEFLRRTPPEQIVAFLRSESPQTLALVVANLPTTLAAQVLACLSSEEQAEVAMRIATMNETSPEVIKEIEGVLRGKFASVVQQEYSAAGGVKSLADILNYTDRTTERNVIESLTVANNEIAEEVRRLLFTFEDLVRLDDRSIQLVLKEVDQKDLALALRGVSEDVKDVILTNMSERGAQMLREEMEYQPPQRRRVVEEAQGRIVAVVRRLEEAGALVISRGAGDDEDAVL